VEPVAVINLHTNFHVTVFKTKIEKKILKLVSDQDHVSLGELVTHWLAFAIISPST